MHEFKKRRRKKGEKVNTGSSSLERVRAKEPYRLRDIGRWRGASKPRTDEEKEKDRLYSAQYRREGKHLLYEWKRSKR